MYVRIEWVQIKNHVIVWNNDSKKELRILNTFKYKIIKISLVYIYFYIISLSIVAHQAIFVKD